MKKGLIAFCGSKGSGKSTSATIFKGMFEGPTEELAFAGHLKNVCSKVFNVDMKYFIDPKLKEVELDAYVNLTKEKIVQVLAEFDFINTDYDKTIRPHVGRVFDTPRTLLQYIGTELLHPLDPLIHVKMTLKNKDPNKLSIVTDLRFKQEFDYLVNQEDYHVYLAYVRNDSAEVAASTDGHPSERQLFLFRDLCEEIDNNGSIAELTNQIRDLVKSEYT